MKIKIEELKELLKQSALKFVSDDEAEYFATEQLDTFLKKQPRSGSLDDVISDLSAWQKNSDKKMEVVVEKNGTLLLNFNSLGPSLKLKYIHEQAVAKAKKNGISFIGINHGGVHTLNLWTDALGRKDMISIFMYNGGPAGVVPFGGTTGIFGTNPISYSIPTLTYPIIVDMATSDIPFFEIADAKKNGTTLKTGVAVDSNGTLTTDPNAALTDSEVANLLPIGGGYKGYAIVLLIEILTGSLIRSKLSTEMTLPYVTDEHGGILITIDIGSLTDINTFKKSVSQMCKIAREQKPAAGIEAITIPGDRNYTKKEEISKVGEVEVSDEIVIKLKEFTK